MTPFEPIDLPAGCFLVSEEMDDRLRRISGAPAREGSSAHPIFAFVAGLGGMGMRVADAMVLGGCSMDTGPLLAACAITLHQPMKVGQAYQVEARITEKVRKGSRRFGAADHLLLTLALSGDGAKYVDLELRMIVPAGTGAMA